MNKRYVLIADDPRCLDSMARTPMWFARTPDIVLAGYSGVHSFATRGIGFADVRVAYAPLEMAVAYGRDIGRIVSSRAFDVRNKITACCVLANSSSGTKQDRPAIIAKAVKGVDGVRVYGNLEADDVRRFEDGVYGGSLTYDDAMAEFGSAVTTFVVPVAEGWATTKYVEALMCGVMPIFHESYNVRPMLHYGLRSVLSVVYSNGLLGGLVDGYNDDKADTLRKVKLMLYAIVEPHCDGKILSGCIMRAVKGE